MTNEEIIELVNSVKNDVQDVVRQRDRARLEAIEWRSVVETIKAEAGQLKIEVEKQKDLVFLMSRSAADWKGVTKDFEGHIDNLKAEIERLKAAQSEAETRGYQRGRFDSQQAIASAEARGYQRGHADGKRIGVAEAALAIQTKLDALIGRGADATTTR